MRPAPVHPSTQPTPDRIESPMRLLALAAAATGVIVVLLVLPWPDLPPRVDQVAFWWDSVGTATAAMVVVRRMMS